jgi:hypothetical protein
MPARLYAAQTNHMIPSVWVWLLGLAVKRLALGVWISFLLGSEARSVDLGLFSCNTSLGFRLHTGRG